MDSVKDRLGRDLEVRIIDVRERRKLQRSCGAASDIQNWFGETVIAACVRSIDGVPVLMPANADQADALVAKIGDGLEDVAEFLKARAATSDVAADAKN